MVNHKKRSKKKLLRAQAASAADMGPTPEPVPEAPYPQWDDIPEYPRPEISPYTTKAITITIGRASYTVPEYFLRPYPAFEINQWRMLDLSDIHKDVGHTLVHYLYTSTYETTKPVIEDPDLTPRAREFHCSMHTYHAARRYGIPGLIDLAKTYIRVFDIDVSTLYILTVAREISSTLPPDEIWFWEYIREKLAIAFEDDEPGLRQDIAAYGVGRDPFDAFLVAAVLDIYASALPGKVLNGHVGTETQSEADVSERNTVEDPEEAYEWDSDPAEPVAEEEPHAIDGPVPDGPVPESPDRYVEGEAAVPELETARSPDPVALSPSPPPPESPQPPPADCDDWGRNVRGRSNGYIGPATGLPARLTTLVEEQSEPAEASVPVEDDLWNFGFRTKKKRGKHYDLAPPPAPPEPVIEEPRLELEPEPEPEPGIPLPEPAVPERAAPPAESPPGNGWRVARNQDFRVNSWAQPVATAE